MQHHVVEKRRTRVKLHVQSVMQIVIKIRARGNNPVHEAGLHQRNQTGFSQAGRSQRAGQAHADEAVVRQHFFREQLGRFAKTSAVVSQKRLIDQISSGNVFADAQRIQTRIGRKFFETFAVFMRGVLRKRTQTQLLFVNFNP